MLDLENIISFVPENLRGFKRNILREYLQCKILEIIFDSKIGLKMVFIGGTSLRIIYNSGRFSEDLDFDNFDLLKSDFQTLVELIQSKLKLDGYDVRIETDFKQKAWHNYIYFPELLFKLDLSPYRNKKFMIKMDTQPHNFSYTPVSELINKFNVVTHLRSAPIDMLLSQKIRTIFGRVQGRDLYDTVFLISKTKPNYDYLRTFLNISAPDELKNKLLLRCDNLNFAKLEEDIKRVVFNPAETKKIALFRSIIEMTEF